ncbi:hypothetical protein [Marinobacter nauticus]|uniref:Uncharacterized protein n=2 Tax=Marinobacter nauticus TaxID=2743 RepID=A0A1M2UXS2_MARNT|nr:hypothetical protein [Marinobacter nauticus]OJT00132.1 hypothetical protein BEE62_08565 [Marinobacter nauticus]OJT00138.1 hypothetical protein BEE62_08600 [Marinobacter nauticus]
MKWFLIYAAMLFGLWHAIDLKAGTVLESAVAPLAFAFVLIAFLVWLSVKVSGSRSSSTGDAGGVTYGGFFGGGGDSCGGGGDGGGGC